MDETELADVVDQVRALVEANYIFPEVAAKVSRVLAAGLASGRYPAGLPALATAVTADLQSVNGDKHLRLKYHEEAIPPHEPATTPRNTPPWRDGPTRRAEVWPARSAWRATWAISTCSRSCSLLSSARRS